MKSRRSRRQKQKRTRRRGGNKYYYEYNRNPRLFTNTTSQLFGGLGPTTTLLPQPLANSIQNASDSSTNFFNAIEGKYPIMSSSVLTQPIN